MNFASPYVELPKKLSVKQNLEIYGRLYGVENLSSRIISGTKNQSKGKSVSMISNIRDEYLVEIQMMRKKYEKKLR